VTVGAIFTVNIITFISKTIGLSYDSTHRKELFMNSIPAHTAYSANVISGLNNKMTGIAKDIESLLTIDKERYEFKIINDNVIAIVGDVGETIPSFFHPIIHNGKAYIDLRAIVNKEGKIRLYNEYVLMVRRAMLDLLWLTDKEVFFAQEAFVADTFSTWVSSGISRKLDNNLLITTNFRIISAIYYMGLFSNEAYAHDEDIIIMLLKRLPRIINIPAQNIHDLINVNEELIIELFRNGSVHNCKMQKNKIFLFAHALTELNNNAYDIDPSIVYNSTVRGAFIAANATEISSIGLEHPPTFIAMMSCAIQKSMQNTTALGKSMMGLLKKHDVEGFTKFISMYADVS